jgi:hypothetical protein
MLRSSPVNDFLDRAGKVFSLAGDLGRAFSEEHRRQRQIGQIDPSSWDRHAALFQEFGDGVLGLQDVMQNPPAGVGHVTEQLLKAAGIAEQIWDTIQQPHGRDEATYLEFFPRLNSLFEDGWRAVNEVTAVKRVTNPFSSIKERPTTNQSDIDTTPAYPEPPNSAIDLAARDIPDIMSNVKLGHKQAIEMVASHLAKQLQDVGHPLAAAHWAIHRSILAGRLVPGRIEMSAPMVGNIVGGAMRNWGGRNDRRTVWSGGQTGTMSIPKGKPAPFDHFKVTATDALWTWWRSSAAALSGPDGGDFPTAVPLTVPERNSAAASSGDGNRSQAAEPAGTAGRKSPRVTTNELMRRKLESNPESHNWTAAQWSESIDRTESTIVDTATWKQLRDARATAAALHEIRSGRKQLDRRRKPRKRSSE